MITRSVSAHFTFSLLFLKVFSEARVYFSGDGKAFSGDAIVVRPKEDCIFEEPRNITIKLHRRIGKYLKLQLFWATKWMLISEVTFDASKYQKEKKHNPKLLSFHYHDG